MAISAIENVDRPILATPEQRREQTREAILKAAWEALVRDGYENITTRGIAKVAGVNSATLHYYFGTKEALLSEATRFALRDTQDQMRQAMEKAPNARAALTDVFDTIWRLVHERPGILRYDLVVRGFRDETARQEVTTIYASYQALTEELISWNVREGGRLAPGLTVKSLAHYMLAAVDGVLLQHVVTKDDATARTALDLISRHALALLNLAVD